jgi:hypothetical protein
MRTRGAVRPTRKHQVAAGEEEPLSGTSRTAKCPRISVKLI